MSLESSVKRDIVNTAMIWIAVVAFILWLSWYWLVGLFAVKFGDNKIIPYLGQFGDSYGALNSLFTGGAFIVLIWTLLMQRKELSLQREELSLQREEMQQTRTVMERQKFEVTLFNLLNRYNDTVSAFEYIKDIGPLGPQRRTIVGVSAISAFLRECLRISNWVVAIERPQFDPKYAVIYSSLSTLLHYVDNFCPEDEAKRYMDLICTNISGAEFCLACIHCMGKKDEKMRLSIAKLVPLHNLNYFGTDDQTPEVVKQLTTYIYGGDSK